MWQLLEDSWNINDRFSYSDLRAWSDGLQKGKQEQWSSRFSFFAMIVPVVLTRASFLKPGAMGYFLGYQFELC